MNQWDQNDNTDQVWPYQNTNSPNGVSAFIGNVVAFEECAYVFNFAINTVTNTKTYEIKRQQMAIEYVPSLSRKSTVMT